MMKVFVTSIFIVCFLSLFAQETLTLNFDSEQLKLQDGSIKTFKYYIGEIHLLKDDTIIYANDTSYYLIDHKFPSSLSYQINLPQPALGFNVIEFTLGVDSKLNELGAFGGDLDPTKGMYWTWQAGYINFKLEGQLRKQEFEYHLGGFLGEYRSDQKVRLTVTKQEQVNLVFLINEFFAKIDLQKTNHIMSPSLTSVRLMEFAAASFKVVE